MAEESKTYVFQPENSGCNAMSMLAPLLANRGMDAATISALMNNSNGFGGNGLWVIFLFFLMGWGGNGWGGGNGNVNTDFLSAQMNNNTGRELLQQAISGNTNAITQLASNLNVSVSQIQSALCNLGTQVQGVSSQMAQGCCDIKNSITTQGYENRLANLEQTNVIGGKIDAQTVMINDKFCQLKEREYQSKIDSLTAQNTALQNQISNLNQNTVTAQIVNQATAPLASALSSVQSEVYAIKSTIPSTVTIPLPIAYNYGLMAYNTNGGSLWS